MIDTSRDTVAWYRQFWPWFLIAMPGSAIVMGMVMLNLAINSPDSLVVDNYYKDGLAINKVLVQDQNALAWGVKGQFSFENGWLVLRLQRKQGVFADRMNLQLFHPVDKQQDREWVLLADQPGVYKALLPELMATQWRMRVEPVDKSWRMQDRIRWPLTTTVHLLPTEY